MIGASPAMQRVFKQIAWVADSNVPVLITGESGTGKELVARAIHRHSSRSEAPFLPVCLAALSESVVESELFGHVKGAFTGATQDRRGLLELAAEGTVFLDEIADTTLSLQVKLLRALEQRELTPVGDARPRPMAARVLAATNRPLAELIERGDFREDLYFRLSVFQIHLPPLRERREDIPALVEKFALSAMPEMRSPIITEEALAELTRPRLAGERAGTAKRDRACGDRFAGRCDPRRSSAAARAVRARRFANFRRCAARTHSRLGGRNRQRHGTGQSLRSSISAWSSRRF